MSKMINQQLILLLVISSTCKGQDVVLTTTHECCNVNDELTLEAEYKGSGTVACVMWTVIGGATSMIINATTCSSRFPIPSGFPHGKMSYDCSFAPKYRLTVQTVKKADLNKTWGVDFSLFTGSTASGRQQQTVTQCEIGKEQDVVLTTTHECFNVNDELTLEAEYKGSGTVARVMWTVTGGATSMIINATTCSSPFPIPSGFPHGRMSYDCSSAPKYRLTVQTVERADLNKIWGVDFSMSTGSTSSGTQQQTVTECETFNESNTGFPWWATVLIVLVIVVEAGIIYGVSRQQQGLKDQLDEGRKSFTNEANKDIEQEIRTNFVKEFDEKNPNEEISNGDQLDEGRKSFTNEANKDIEQEIRTKSVDQSPSFPSIKDIIQSVEESCKNTLNKIHMHCTSEADREIRQWPEINPTDEPTDEPNTRLTRLGAHVEIEDIRHESDNHVLLEERHRLINEANKYIPPRNEIDPPDEKHMPATNEAKKDNGKEIGSNSAMEFDKENHNKEISNGDVLHEERRRLTNEAIRYYIRTMNEIDLLNEERRPLTNGANENIQQRNEINGLPEECRRLTNEANEDIQQKTEINRLNEESIPRTNTLNLSKPDDVITNSENNSLKTKPLFLSKDTGLMKRKRNMKKKRSLHTI